ASAAEPVEQGVPLAPVVLVAVGCRALGLGTRLVARAAIRERAREPQPDGGVLRREREGAAQEALAFGLVAAEQPRRRDQEGALAGERGDVVGRELERAVDVLPEPAELRQALHARAGELHLPAAIAE